MPEQTGPLGDSSWIIDVGPYTSEADSPLRVDVSLVGEDGIACAIAWVKSPETQHLRDFARALERAAEALEAAPPEPLSPIRRAMNDRLRQLAADSDDPFPPHREDRAPEAASEPAPTHWLGPTGGFCGYCGLPWPCTAYLQKKLADALERRVSDLDDPSGPHRKL